MNRLVAVTVVSSLMLAGMRAAEPPLGGTVRFEQRIGAQLPLTTKFVDLQGERHALRDYFHGRPVVLYFGYARCPQLCSVVADGTLAALRQIRPEVGKDFSVVAISIDPDETPLESRRRAAEAVHRYGRGAQEGAEAGWNFLTGSERAIRDVTSAAGFSFAYDPRSRQYAHASGFLVATPDGIVSRYFLGVDFVPVDVARAIQRAGEGGRGPRVFDLLLLCFRGDGVSGRYGTVIWRVLWAAVTLTVVGLASFIGRMLLAERRSARKADS